VAVALCGHTVTAVDSAEKALRIAQTRQMDLCLMEMGTGQPLDDIRTAVTLRRRYRLPSLFITDCKESETIKDAMRAAPLAYLIKPVTKENIEAALMVAQSRIGKLSGRQKTHHFGAFEYIPESRTFMKNGEPLLLTPFESRCLWYLFKKINTVIPSHELIMAVWEEEKELFALRELIFRVRKKVPELIIRNVHASGYMLTELS
jgi:DNA-binding response OmpR family regulator